MFREHPIPEIGSLISTSAIESVTPTVGSVTSTTLLVSTVDPQPVAIATKNGSSNFNGKFLIVLITSNAISNF